jgi:hypothetical protein
MAVTGPFRVSFFFTQQGDRLGGWSENYWSNLSSVAGVQAAAMTLQQALWQTKGNGVNAPYIRISQVGAFRSAFIVNTNLTSVPLGNAADADISTTALLLLLTGPVPYTARQWLRGIYDNAVTLAGHYNPSAGYATVINNLFTTLSQASNGWVLRNLNQANLKQLITAVTLPGVVTVPGHGFATGQVIRISRTGGITGLNGTWHITVIDANTFQLIGVPAGGFVGRYTKSGTAQLQTYLYQAITGGSVLRATKHNVGRPFGQLTGRRKRRASTAH